MRRVVDGSPSAAHDSFSSSGLYHMAARFDTWLQTRPPRSGDTLMNSTLRLLLTGVAALAFSAHVAMAQTANPSPANGTTTAKAAKATKAKVAKAKSKTVKAVNATRSAASVACSTEATAKNLRGKPRVAFRKKCMAGKKKIA
jgi:psiF repeat